MDLKQYKFSDAKPGAAVALAEKIAQQPYHETLIHQLVVSYQANARQATKSQKSRSEVKSGGRKPWKQKGTGRARAGCKTGPLWRGGGVTFAANGEQNYKQKMNKKAYRAAIRSVLAELSRHDRLMVVDDVALDQPKTKDMAAKLRGLNVSGYITILVDEINTNAMLASSNIPGCYYHHINYLNPVALLKSQHVMVTKSALAQLEERLA